MARLPYLKDVEAHATPALMEKIKARRRGQLGDLDRLLIHSDPVARGWNELFGALATDCDIDIRIREFALLRIGILNRGRYEYHQHRLIALKAGISEEEIAALADWNQSDRFNPRERAVLAYTDAMTTSVQVSDEVFASLRPHFSDRQIVELTANIAGYNMVTRFMEALELLP